jgi:hypothetical protein
MLLAHLASLCIWLRMCCRPSSQHPHRDVSGLLDNTLPECVSSQKYLGSYTLQSSPMCGRYKNVIPSLGQVRCGSHAISSQGLFCRTLCNLCPLLASFSSLFPVSGLPLKVLPKKIIFTFLMQGQPWD